MKQMDKGLALAQQRYFRSVEAAAQNKGTQHGPWLVAEDIPAALFEAWSSRQESRWKLAYEDHRGRVLLYGDPSPVHENTAGFFSQLIVIALTKLGDDAGGESVTSAASPLRQLVNSRKEPDFSLTPSDCLEFTPTIVGEVAFKNETLPRLKRELSRWTAREDLAQMCIGILVKTPRNARQDPYLTIWWKKFGTEHQFLHFGKGTQCSQSNLPRYMFDIPFDLLFARSSLTSVLVGSEKVSIDLYKLRRKIKQTLVANPDLTA